MKKFEKIVFPGFSPGEYNYKRPDNYRKPVVICEWQIDEPGPVLLSDIDVRIERDQDNVYIYSGLCSTSAKTCDTTKAPSNVQMETW